MTLKLRKLSEITPASATPALTDQIVGITGGATDNLFTVGQMALAVGRTKLAGNIDYNVTITGSDSGDGSSGAPWATIQHALNSIAQNVDINGKLIRVLVGPGTFDGYGHPVFTGGGIVYVRGSGSGSTTIQEQSHSGPWDISNPNGAPVYLNFENPISCGVNRVAVTTAGPFGTENACVANASLNIFTCGDPAQTEADDILFLPNSNCFGCYSLAYGSSINLGSGIATGSLSVECADGGNSPFGFSFCEFGGAFVLNNNITCIGTPAFGGDAVVRASTGGQFIGNTGVMLGAATGSRYEAIFGSNIADNFAGQNWFAGDSSGFTDGTSTYGGANTRGPKTYIDQDYTLRDYSQAPDFYGVVIMQSAAPHILTVPLSSSFNMGAGAAALGLRIVVLQAGTGAVTVAAAAGVTGNNFGVIGGQWKSAVLYQMSLDNWVMLPGGFC